LKSDGSHADRLRGWEATGKRTFMELLGKHGVPAFDYEAAELTDDLRHA
jgi:hypothetical protein